MTDTPNDRMKENLYGAVGSFGDALGHRISKEQRPVPPQVVLRSAVVVVPVIWRSQEPADDDIRSRSERRRARR